MDMGWLLEDELDGFIMLNMEDLSSMHQMLYLARIEYEERSIWRCHWPPPQKYL